MENGDKAYYRYQGIAVLKDGAPQYKRTGIVAFLDLFAERKINNLRVINGVRGTDPDQVHQSKAWPTVRACSQN